MTRPLFWRYGMRLRDENGNLVELGSVLGKGGEAEVWSCTTHTQSVAKIYHVPSREHENKLRAMVAQPPVDPTRSRGHVSICWPQSLLYEANGNRNLGFLMPRVDLSQHRELFKIYNAKTRQTEAPSFTWAYLVTAAENIANVVESIHTRGYVVGDMNESNFFISGQALATIVDCDSMQVRASTEIFHCTVAKPEYMAPELLGSDLSKVVRTQAQDNFALAVLIFHLLMEGFHPYSGKWNKTGDAPSIEERISNGDSPYGGSSRISPSPGAPPFEILPKEVRELFVRAFYLGNRDPTKRPSAMEWQQSLHLLGTRLGTCKTNQQHRYASYLSRCPWCERKVLLGGFDPFLAPSAQRALPKVPLAQPPVPRPQPRTTGGSAPSFTLGSAHGLLANRYLFRFVSFALPLFSAVDGALLVSGLGWRSGLLVRNTWVMLAIAGLTRRIQRQEYKAGGLFVAGCAALYLLLAAVVKPLSTPGRMLEMLEEAVLAFLVARFLLQVLRVRMDNYRLMGQTGKVAVMLGTSLLLVPTAALAVMIGGWAGPVSSLVSKAGLGKAPLVAPFPANVSTCSNVLVKCGCIPQSTFHPGETVKLVVVSSREPRLTIQLQPPGEALHTPRLSPWIVNGAQYCSVGHYKIPAKASTGFTAIHLLADQGAKAPAHAETGFSVAR